MLAFGRALVLNPKLLLLDEPLEGLAPIIVDELLRAIRRVARDEGLPSIVVEQHPHMVLGVTDDAIVLDRGGIAYRAKSEDAARPTRSRWTRGWAWRHTPERAGPGTAGPLKPMRNVVTRTDDAHDAWAGERTPDPNHGRQARRSHRPRLSCRRQADMLQSPSRPSPGAVR